ncbi:hypothetical protein TNCV_4601101 [Trichonephila clavipes]|nr:hypothetical protein TNCV_4601101 [Trichonephila clavipes]
MRAGTTVPIIIHVTIDAEVHEQMSRFGGLSEERPSVFKTRSKLGTHLSTQCSGDERQESTLRSPLIEPQTCGVEALYTTTDLIR